MKNFTDEEMMTYLVECANREELLAWSNGSTQQIKYGDNDATIVISDLKHYFIIHNESVRERVIRFLIKHQRYMLKEADYWGVARENRHIDNYFSRYLFSSFSYEDAC